MINSFVKTLGFLKIDASGNKLDKIEDKNFMFRFNDDQINQAWILFYSGYRNGDKQGKIAALNRVSIHCIREIENV